MLCLLLLQLPSPGLVLAWDACVDIIVPELSVKISASRLLLNALINDIYVIRVFVCTHIHI